jgi:hypothetical protein
MTICIKRREPVLAVWQPHSHSRLTRNLLRSITLAVLVLARHDGANAALRVRRFDPPARDLLQPSADKASSAEEAVL